MTPEEPGSNPVVGILYGSFIYRLMYREKNKEKEAHLKLGIAERSKAPLQIINIWAISGSIPGHGFIKIEAMHETELSNDSQT